MVLLVVAPIVQAFLSLRLKANPRQFDGAGRTAAIYRNFAATMPA
jgi:hypothetical protein